MKKYKVVLTAFHLFFLMLQYTNATAQTNATDIKVSRIYSDENYNAFTSLIKFKDRFYCAFRSGEKHVYGKDGIIKILTSKDGSAWKEIGVIGLKGFDLRDPKLSITPDGRIMVTMGGSIYKGKELLGGIPHVAFSNTDGAQFSYPRPINLEAGLKGEFDWLWSLTWFQGTGYGGLYSL